jgi:hypothetical protein
MHLSSVLAVLSFGSALAAPVVQQPLAENVHHAGPHAKPYTPENRDPYDKKIDTVKDKLQPLPWVSSDTRLHFQPSHCSRPADMRTEKWRRRKHAGPAEQRSRKAKP